MIYPANKGIKDIAKVWKNPKTPYENPRIFLGTAMPTAEKLTL